ncbi:MAG: glycogen/starch synthase [Candidatus Muiribacteriota bacterium]
MNIFHLASEVNPYIKTGGLADVVGSLPVSQASIRGNKVNILMPLYKKIPENFDVEYFTDFSVDTPYGKKTVIVKTFQHTKNIKVFFIGEYGYYFRDEIYGDYEDNAERFAFFSKSSLELIKKLDIKPDVVHCHDWQTGLTSFYGKKDKFFNNTVFAFTIHNIAYQGLFNYSDLYTMDIDSSYFTQDYLEFYGKGSMLKAGIVFSDFVNTVSPSYRNETLTPEYGFGMDGLLQSVSFKYSGIVNGIDIKEWNAEKDKMIYKKYSADKIDDKEINKKKLFQDMNLKYHSESALFVAVTRLAEQKGIELIINNIKFIAENGHKLIILGSGDKFYEDLLIEFEKKYAENVRVILKYDFELAHKLYAGADFFLMPSKFEPCGLSQLISLLYGTIPVVRKTGGLADTVLDLKTNPEIGTGFVFENFFIDEFQQALDNALTVFKNKNSFKNLKIRAMNQDFTWDNTSKEYLKLYKQYLNKIKNNAEEV